MIGKSRSTVGNLFSTNWSIVQISHRTAIAEWHGETRAGALIGDRRDRIRVCDGVTGSSGAKVKRVADPLQWRYEAHMGAEKRVQENVLQFPRFSKKYRKEFS